MKHRLFIASFIQPEISMEIRRMQEQFRPAGLKFTPTENFHITYSFLDLRDESEVPHIKSFLPMLNEIIAGISFHLSDVLCFEQHGRSPVVLRVEFSKDISAFIENFQRISGGDAKPFVPHITVAKANNGCVYEIVEEYKKLFAGFRKNFILEKAVLAKSILSPEGPVYRII